MRAFTTQAHQDPDHFDSADNGAWNLFGLDGLDYALCEVWPAEQGIDIPPQDWEYTHDLLHGMEILLRRTGDTDSADDVLQLRHLAELRRHWARSRRMA